MFATLVAFFAVYSFCCHSIWLRRLPINLFPLKKKNKICHRAHKGGEKPSHRHSTYTNLLEYTGSREPLIKKYVNQSDIKITKKKNKLLSFWPYVRTFRCLITRIAKLCAWIGFFSVRSCVLLDKI